MTAIRARRRIGKGAAIAESAVKCKASWTGGRSARPARIDALESPRRLEPVPLDELEPLGTGSLAGPDPPDRPGQRRVVGNLLQFDGRPELCVRAAGRQPG